MHWFLQTIISEEEFPSVAQQVNRFEFQKL